MLRKILKELRAARDALKEGWNSGQDSINRSFDNTKSIEGIRRDLRSLWHRIFLIEEKQNKPYEYITISSGFDHKEMEHLRGVVEEEVQKHMSDLDIDALIERAELEEIIRETIREYWGNLNSEAL